MRADGRHAVLDVSRLNIDAVLTSPFDALPAEQHERARHAVDEATAHVGTAELVDHVPDEMLDSLADSAPSAGSGPTVSWSSKTTVPSLSPPSCSVSRPKSKRLVAR
ncbi:hypothetical protein [Streptomyces sp. NPDC048521]|uniref:hypothetical protein n=1 Tax=Streptomyces sp. NPDC048521 TaxID=3365566 RepID=UPI003710C1F9